jgi:AraC family transcriptional regulator of arabinose operon
MRPVRGGDGVPGLALRVGKITKAPRLIRQMPADFRLAFGASVVRNDVAAAYQATGGNLLDYLNELGVSVQAPLVWMGDDLQIARLFNEVSQNLEQGSSFLNLLQASHALAHLLVMMIRHRHEHSRDTSDSVQKVAAGIIYTSEHLDQPMRVSALAALANLSAAHFSVLFKEQTGCSPRDYLHLLRIHRACQLLRSSNLNVKEIATRLGYQDQFHFSRQFKAFQVVPPSEYRDRRPD